MKQTWQKRIRIFTVIAVVLFALVLTGVLFLLFRSVASDPQQFKRWLEGFGWLGRLVLIGMMAMQVLVALLPGEIIEVGAGVAYGPLEGMVLCLAGAAIGTVLIFCLVRRFGMNLVECLISRERLEKLSFMKNEQKLNGLIFLIFFIPGSPKDLVTYFAGLTPVKGLSFLVITTFARIPSVVTSTLAGDRLIEQDFMTAAAVYGLTLAISGAGLLIMRTVMRKKQAAAQCRQKEMEKGKTERLSVKGMNS